MLGNNSLDLCRHFFDLYMGQDLNAEVVIFLKLALDNVVAFIEGSNNILVENLIAQQLQKVESADGIVALRFWGFQATALSVQ